jgi:hypothetical protein
LEFFRQDDAKAKIRAAVEYLLRDVTGGTRGDIVQEIIAIVQSRTDYHRTSQTPWTMACPGG